MNRKAWLRCVFHDSEIETSFSTNFYRLNLISAAVSERSRRRSSENERNQSALLAKSFFFCTQLQLKSKSDREKLSRDSQQMLGEREIAEMPFEKLNYLTRQSRQSVMAKASRADQRPPVWGLCILATTRRSRCSYATR